MSVLPPVPQTTVDLSSTELTLFRWVRDRTHVPLATLASEMHRRIPEVPESAIPHALGKLVSLRLVRVVHTEPAKNTTVLIAPEGLIWAYHARLDHTPTSRRERAWVLGITLGVLALAILGCVMHWLHGTPAPTP